MAARRLPVPRPTSAGVFLSYRCTTACKHCLYACSPGWPADWIAEEDAERVLSQLAPTVRRYAPRDRIGVNEGIHFTGGEPFLNFGLLLRLAEMASRLAIPATFVETNAFWCRDDEMTRDRLEALKRAGLQGILVSANPFILERIPFERTERAARISREVFGHNAIVYQGFFYDQFSSLGLRGSLPFAEYVAQAGHGLRQVELFASGRVPYKLASLFHCHPASRFFGASCRWELLRDWHVHVDNHCNLLPGFCGGLSLGDARDLDVLCQGTSLDRRPVLRALLTNLEDLYHLGLEAGYEAQEGYVSKCHLCLDVRRHLVHHGEFEELKPAEFYDHLED